MTKPEIIETVKERLIKTYNPKTIYLFGSYAWGTPDEDSDLDLLVVIESSEFQLFATRLRKRGSSYMKPHKAWIIKASNDLKSALKPMSGNDTIPDTAIYHAQQCAEKALKAYLAFRTQPIQKSHDLELLADLCSDLDEQFGSIMDDAKLLTPYHTAFRYSDIEMSPGEEDVSEAIGKAEKILEFVKSLIK